jgi:hypothetical protein
MNAADGLPYNRVARIVAGTDGVEISTDETDKIPMFYALGPDWRVTSAMPGDGYLSWRPSRPWAGPTTLAPSATVRIWAGGAWSEQQVPYGLPQGGALPSIRPAGRQAPPPGPRDVLEPSAAR